MLLELKNSAQLTAAEVVTSRVPHRNERLTTEQSIYPEIFVIEHIGGEEGGKRGGLYTDYEETPKYAQQMIDSLKPLENELDRQGVESGTLATIFNSIIELSNLDEDFRTVLLGGFLNYIRSNPETSKQALALKQFGNVLESQLVLRKIAQPLQNLEGAKLGISHNDELWQMIHILLIFTEGESQEWDILEKLGITIREQRRSSPGITTGSSQQLEKIENILLWELGEE
jgi:hypothetical protein